jgi:hypothetical protein
MNLAMLQFDRKQLASIGQTHLQQSLHDFLRRHLPQASQMPSAQLRGALDNVIADCRARGLNSQRAIAAYALAACTLGSATVNNDPALQRIVAMRQLPQAHKALLIQTWLARMGAELGKHGRS